MAKYVPMDLLRSLHGKVCGHSDMYFAEKAYGTKYTGRLCNPRTKPYTSAELALQDKFRATSAAVSTALADPTERAKYEAAFANQSRYRTLYGYTFAQLYNTEGN